MSKNNKSTTAAVSSGFTGTLTIAFIILKLCNVINWSWLWVISPLWISAALFLITFIVALLFCIRWVSNEGFQR